MQSPVNDLFATLLETIAYVAAATFVIYWIIFFAKVFESWRLSSKNSELILSILFVIGIIIIFVVGQRIPFWFIAK